MERDYGWPVAHREGWPDLVGTEKEIDAYLSLFNARSSSIKGVFINQFGFSRRKCGGRVPEGAEFVDLRVGSDVEFGFSIYEPFGIAQLETVPFGGIAALSSSCGCAALLEKCLDGGGRDGGGPGGGGPGGGDPGAGKARGEAFRRDPGPAHYRIFPFADGRGPAPVTTEQRFALERELFRREAEGLFRVLPKNDRERLALLAAVEDRLECLGWESAVNSMSPATL
jgi:hypothetical protein